MLRIKTYISSFINRVAAKSVLRTQSLIANEFVNGIIAIRTSDSGIRKNVVKGLIEKKYSKSCDMEYTKNISLVRSLRKFIHDFSRGLVISAERMDR